jgi:hypothetical protein
MVGLCSFPALYEKHEPDIAVVNLLAASAMPSNTYHELDSLCQLEYVEGASASDDCQVDVFERWWEWQALFVFALSEVGASKHLPTLVPFQHSSYQLLQTNKQTSRRCHLTPAIATCRHVHKNNSATSICTSMQLNLQVEGLHNSKTRGRVYLTCCYVQQSRQAIVRSYHE